MIDYDLILSEQEMVDSKEAMKKITKHINDKMNRYISSVETILANGVMEGISHDNLKVYLESVKKLKENMVNEIQALIVKEIEQHMMDFDDADDVLF